VRAFGVVAFARARLKELEEEAAAIRKAFPGLRKADILPEATAPAAAATTRKRKRNKRKMSPEARKAAAERMKAYWAKKRSQ
jgi:hypothetical protein